MSVFPRLLYQLRRAHDYLEARRIDRRLADQEYWPVERIRELQQTRIDDLVRHAAARSPFYRELYREIDLTKPVDLATLPTTDKLLLMDNFDRAVTDGRLKLDYLERNFGRSGASYYLGRYYVHSSTGSSGHKGTYVLDRRERQTGIAAHIRRNRIAGVTLARSRPRRYATFGSTSDMRPRRGWTLDAGLWPGKTLTIDHRDSLAGWVEALNDFQPDSLWGVPSQIALLASEQLDGRLRMQPKLVITCGEVCTPAAQSLIREAWGVSPFDDWGFSEAGGLVGGDCRYHSGLHFYWDVCVVEIVDNENKPVPAGAVGDKLLITNLNGYTLPRIRFEIPDFVAMVDEQCPCGRTLPLVSIAEGRSEDALTLPGLDGNDVFIHPLHFRARLANIPGIKEYQVVYDGESLTVLAALRDGASSDGVEATAASRLRESLSRNKVVLPEIRVEIVGGDRIERDPAHRGKLKLVIDKRRRGVLV